MTTKRSIARKQTTVAPAPSADAPVTAAPPPFTGLHVALVLEGQQAGAWRIPLAETYAETEQAVQGLAANITSTLARLYDDRARHVIAAERQRTADLEAELAALKAKLAGGDA